MTPLEAIAGIIRDRRRFLITSHINPDGDSIGSQLALKHLLRALGKEAAVINRDAVPFTFRFLPGADDVAGPQALKLPYDATFMLDCGQFDRTGGVVPDAPDGFGAIISIDHHATGTPWAAFNLLDSSASSTAELIFRLAEACRVTPDKAMATCLYTGLVADTGSFRYVNTSPRALRLAADLVALGADPAMVAAKVWDTVPYAALKLLGLALGSLAISEDNLVAWIVIPGSFLAATGTAWEATEEFINFPRSIPSVMVAVGFKEISDNEVKVSFRSRENLNVAAIALRHGGGGHVNAAGCTVKATLSEAVAMIIPEVRAAVREYSPRETN